MQPAEPQAERNAAVARQDSSSAARRWPILEAYRQAWTGASADEALYLQDSRLEVGRGYRELVQAMQRIGGNGLAARASERDHIVLDDGVTFGTSSKREPFPFDLMPRLVRRYEWDRLSGGLDQRARALSLFLDDVYGPQTVVADGVVPAELIRRSPGWLDDGVLPGLEEHPPRALVMGTDLLKNQDDEWLVLEDNLRVPSGLGYAMEARRILSAVLPELLDVLPRRALDDAPAMLLAALEAAAPPTVTGQPSVAVLSAGEADSAWFEHRMLAARMGVPLVVPQDLRWENGRLTARQHGKGIELNVLYRRIGDDTLTVSRDADGEWLWPQLVRCVREGRLWLGNALGNGVADDKAVYAFVPRLIQYYLDEQPILANVPTWHLGDPAAQAETLDRLEELVVKPVDGSGGDGVVIGPQASQGELAELRVAVKANPSRYVAQELVEFKTHPTLVDGALTPRYVDLRTFTICGPDPVVVALPLTRVALTEGSRVVNSSRGGGAKDTWLLDD